MHGRDLNPFVAENMTRYEQALKDGKLGKKKRQKYEQKLMRKRARAVERSLRLKELARLVLM